MVSRLPTLVIVKFSSCSLFYADIVFYLKFLSLQNHRNKSSNLFVRVHFFTFLADIFFSKRIYLGLCLSSMSLYRLDRKKKISFLKNIDFWDTLFQCKKETLQKYPCSMTKYKKGLAKNSLQLIFKMTTPGMNLRDLNMHFPHSKFLNSWLIWGLSVFTSLFIFKNKQTKPLIQRVCSNILYFLRPNPKSSELVERVQVILTGFGLGS